MGLGKKLGQKNAQTATQLASVKQDVGTGGYNADNMRMAPMPSMTSQEVQEVREVCAGASRDINGMTQLGSLMKPTVPQNSDPARREINNLVVEKIWRIICLRKLHNVYTQDRLQSLVNRACNHDYRMLQREWGIATIDMAVDLAVLGLYDIVLFGDDSGSMRTSEPKEDNMTRVNLMKEVVKTLSFWATLFDEDGVVVRFFNSAYEGNGISNPREVDDMFRQVRPTGVTPMGEELDKKILSEFVYPMLTNEQLDRPVLIITVTDGVPYNGYNEASSKVAVYDAILRCHSECKKSKYGEHAVAFSFAQIGTDKAASNWLGEIDTDKYIGHLIDCTSEYHMEKEECEKNHPGVVFSEATWLVKLMIGAIDPEYDQADEGPSTQKMPVYGSNLQYGDAPPAYPG